ncbi:MAG TPA: peptide-methionine (R)-S-oxide reductase [Hyphomicrobiaceae bacterium]|jgi:peptide-methionine (R)-S-oxide reductase
MSNNQPDQRTGKLVKSAAAWRAELTPSFDPPVCAPALSERDGRFLFMRRPEGRGAHRGGRLGHVLPDGPRETTGLRCCINGVALKFRPEDG